MHARECAFFVFVVIDNGRTGDRCIADGRRFRTGDRAAVSERLSIRRTDALRAISRMLRQCVRVQCGSCMQWNVEWSAADSGRLRVHAIFFIRD